MRPISVLDFAAANPNNNALTRRRFPVPPGIRVPPGLRGMGAMGGIFSDILHLGEEWLQNRIVSSGISGLDPIAIQNQVAAAMDELSAEYYPLRDSNSLTVTQITQFQTAMQTLINSFCSRMRQIGSSRALAGCSTIQYWGGKWIQDRDTEKAALVATGTVSTANTIIDPVTGQPIPIGTAANGGAGTSSFTQYLPYILAGVFIYAMVKTSHRW